MKKSLMSIAVILLSAAIAFAQEAREKSQQEQVDKLFARWDKPDSPGCALAIIKNGQIIYRRAYGMADLERGVPITTTSVFDVGSISKQFTALSIALLAKQGKLSLDDDIRKYIPEIPDYGSRITIRNLIYHTSGLRDYVPLMALAEMPFENYYRYQQLLDLLARQKELNFKPGEEHFYSNSGYLLLAQIVRQASGKSLRDFAEENIFKPLEMNNTRFLDDHGSIVRNRAIGYTPKEDGNGYNTKMSFFDLVGDGGLLTTVEDLFLWDQNFYQNKLGGGGSELVNQLLIPGTLSNGKPFQYAYGLRISEYKGLPIVRHGGEWAGYVAEMIRFPKQNFSVILLANTDSINPARLTKLVAEIYLADQLKKDPDSQISEHKFIDLPLTEIENKVGTYLNNRNGAVWSISVKDGKLIATNPRGVSFQFGALSKTRFLSTQFQLMNAPMKAILEFKRPTSNQEWTAALTIGDQESAILELVVLVSPSQGQLAEYTGDYFSSELQVTYKVRLENGKLVMKDSQVFDAPLKPTVKDSFVAGGPLFKFIRDSHGKVFSFTLRLALYRMNIQFVRIRR
jgi:CubicO group peptidase (beta-lactamase class C family)